MAEKAVIFDMDGVLIDSYRAHYESWRKLAEAHGLEMTEQQFADTFGMTSREIIRRLWPAAADEKEIPRWDGEKEQYYRDILREDFPQMPGSAELIEALHQAGFAMAIGSSGPPENVRVVLEQLRGGERIAATVDGHEVSRGKPDPEVFLTTAEKLGVPPANCAVIEDAVAGLQAARRAGMAAVGITGTAPRGKLAEHADTVVDSLEELSPRRVAELIQAKQ
ncbi:MAG: HAD family hydrolase [Phycisphaerae bacterium]